MKLACVLVSVLKADSSREVIAVAPNDDYWFVRVEMIPDHYRSVVAEIEAPGSLDVLGALFTSEHKP